MRVVVNALQSNSQNSIFNSCLLLCVFLRRASSHSKTNKRTLLKFFCFCLLLKRIVIVVVANVVPPHPHAITLETAKQTVHILPHPHTSRDVAQAQNSGIC